MSPHIFTPKTRLQPAEFLITCAKRLLQQYRPKATQLLRGSEMTQSAISGHSKEARQHCSHVAFADAYIPAFYCQNGKGSKDPAL